MLTSSGCNTITIRRVVNHTSTFAKATGTNPKKPFACHHASQSQFSLEEVGGEAPGERGGGGGGGAVHVLSQATYLDTQSESCLAKMGICAWKVDENK